MNEILNFLALFISWSICTVVGIHLLLCVRFNVFTYSCSRLGLTSLAYLWERDQHELLTSMIDDGIDARIIKTAAMGLFPSKHLGLSLSDAFSELCRLVWLFPFSKLTSSLLQSLYCYCCYCYDYLFIYLSF